MTRSAKIDAFEKLHLMNHFTCLLIALIPFFALSSHAQTPSADVITAMAWKSDGSQIAVGYENGAVHILDSESEQVAMAVEGHTAEVFSLDWQRDSDRLLSSGADGQIKIWDTATGELIKSLVLPSGRAVFSAVWNADGTQVISTSDDFAVRVWDVNTEKTICGYTHGDYPTSVALHPQDHVIASASWDGAIVLWDLDKCQQILSLNNDSGMWSVAWRPDGNALVAGSMDNSIYQWDATTGQILDVFKGHEDSILIVAWSSDGRWLASGSFDGSVRLWDGINDRVVEIIQNDQPIYSLDFSPDSRQLAYGVGKVLEIVEMPE
jgi:WD40 repeat protein